MGRMRVASGRSFGMRELPWSTLIGRHWSCDIRLQHPDAPLRWVEVRWIKGQWGWRALSREGDTVGPSRWLTPGWRVLTPGKRGGASLRLRDIATVELVDGTPPVPHAVDLQTGQILVNQPLHEALAAAGCHQWRSALGTPLADGTVLLAEGRPLRLHLPHQAQKADYERPSLLHPDTLLKLDVAALSGAFELQDERIELSTEMVRILLPYAEARLEKEEDAWLTREEAHDRWLELGGNPDSPPERLGWQRGKVKSHLSKGGFLDVGCLFESKRVGQWYGCRLGLMPEQIALI